MPRLPSWLRIRHRPSISTTRTHVFSAPGPLRFWHLASLDAPSVALVWSLSFAWIAHVRLPLWVPALLVLAVWAVYVADRLLDARNGLRGGNLGTLRERHLFHWRHRHAFLPLAVLAAVAAAFLVFDLMPTGARERNTILAAASLVYFTRVHVGRGLRPSFPRWLCPPFPKELLVGLLFTAGCVIPSWSRSSLPVPALLIPAVFFAILAWLNCHAIDQWEGDSSSASPQRIALTAGIVTAAGLLAAALLLHAQPRSARTARSRRYGRPPSHPARCDAKQTFSSGLARSGSSCPAHATASRPRCPAPAMSSPPDFNRLARVYRWMEALTFGPCLWWCRCTWLNSLATGRPKCALVLGDGDGRFTARLLRTCPDLRVDAVDASSAMLRTTLKRASSNVGPDAARLRIFLADARGFQPPHPPYDLIVTHFFLDCLTTAEVQALAATLSRATAPNAQWLVSDFAVPPNLYGRLIAQPLVSFLYFAFGRLTGLAPRTLPDHRSALSRSGFKLLKQRSLLGGLLTSELWGFNAHQDKAHAQSSS